MKLNFLKNPDLNLQEKMRFFADYFLFANEYLGKLPELLFDNPHSLTDKIIFQIENNLERCPVYIQNYFMQLFNFYKNPHVDRSVTLKEIENEYALYSHNKESKEKVIWIKQNNNFLNSLKILRSEYEEKLFDENFAALLSYMICPHPLANHKTEIQYCTQILVSQFRLNGHTKESVNKYIDRVVSLNIYDFPFPHEILQRNKHESFREAAQEFLNNRYFRKQFEGLRNLMNTPKIQKGYFMYAIEDCILDDEIKENFQITFDKVTFISPDHTLLQKLKQSVLEEDEEKTFKVYPKFFGKNKLLAYVNLYYEDKNATKDIGIKIVNEELLQLNGYLNAGLTLNANHYLFSEQFKEDDWWSSVSIHEIKHTRIDSNEYNSAKNNPFEKLKDSGSPAKNQILHNERIFLKAHVNDEISSYWQYLENMFWFEVKEIEDIKKKSEQILLKQLGELKHDFLFNIGLLITPFHIREDEIGLSKKDIFTIHEQIIGERNFNFDIVSYRIKLKVFFLKI